MVTQLLYLRQRIGDYNTSLRGPGGFGWSGNQRTSISVQALLTDQRLMTIDNRVLAQEVLHQALEGDAQAKRYVRKL